MKKFEGWQIHGAVALAVIVCVLWYVGVIPTREYEMLLGLLGFGAASLIRMGQIKESKKVCNEVKEVKRDVQVAANEASEARQAVQELAPGPIGSRLGP